MNSLKNLKFLLSLLLVSAVMMAGFAKAQSAPNQSDVTGTNIFDLPVPLFEPGSGLDPQILTTANQLSQQINQVYGEYQSAESLARQQVRRYSRNRRDQICVNPQAARLQSLLEQARTLLGTVDSKQAEILKTNPAFKPW